ncbi:MAG: glycosyltransferase family 2 protein [Muribaculaceae bacterium]|nr:glycosyltransferase family 2 protein [Muribaculaceae bacterium]
MTTVSVIIPTFNNAARLPDCIRSVISQSGDFRLETIIVNDGSTDTTAGIISEYQKAYPGTIKVISQQNRGQSTARNHALDIASGHWIVFVDADDRLLPGAISHLLHVATALSAPITCGTFVRREKAASATRSQEIAAVDSYTAIGTLLYQTDPRLNSSLWGKIFSRHLFDGLRLWDGHIYEDLDIMPRLFLRASAIALTTANVYLYQHNPHSTLSVWSDRRKDMLEVVSRIIAIPEIAADRALTRAAQDRAFSAACNCLLNMILNNDRDRTTHRRCLDIIRSTAPLTLRNSRARLKNRLAALLLSLLP